MSNEEFRCSRKYHTEWSKLIKRRFSELERLERAESSASEKLEDVSDALNERLKEISDRREKALDELAIAALDCLQLPPDDLAACQEKVNESGKKINEALDAEEQKARKEAEDKRKAIRDKRGAARTRFQDRDRQIDIEIKDLGKKLAACVEKIQGSSGISQAPAFGAPSELLPTIAFVGEAFADAVEFYREWKIPTHAVKSIEEVVTRLAQPRLTPLQRIRFTCHSNVAGMSIAMFRNGPGYRQKFMLTEIELRSFTAGDKAYFAHVIFGGAAPLSSARVKSVVNNLDATAGFFTKLHLGSVTPLLEEMVGWLFFANTSERAFKINPQTFRAKRAFLRAARLASDDLKRTAATTGLDAQALDELDQAVDELLANAARLGIEPFSLNGITSQLAKRVKAAVVALDNNFRQTLDAARAMVTKETCLDLRGCILAQLGNDFPVAVAEFFSMRPKLVNAPEWFTAVGPADRPVKIVSLECPDDLKKQARRPYVRSYYRRWLRDLGLGNPFPGVPDFERLVFYFHRIAPILPILQVWGTAQNPKSKLDVLLSLAFLCKPEKPREAMSVWLRGLWLDAPEHVVDELVSKWLKNDPPSAEAIVEEVDLFDRDTTGVAFPMTPSYLSHFLTA